MKQCDSIDITSKAMRAVSFYDTGLDPYSLKNVIRDCDLELETIPGVGIRDKYNYMLTHYYHNEAYIKATFIKKMLMKGNHVSFFEFPVGNSRTDLVKINGHSVVFEIKTDYDSFYRLDKQINDYCGVFDYVYVICPIKKIDEIRNRLPEYVGIYGYSDTPASVHYTLQRKAKRNLSVSPRKQLECLNQAELRTIFHSDKTKKELISWAESNLSPEMVSKGFRDALKRKYSINWAFLKTNANRILDIDFQWFFKSMIPPQVIYG